MSKTPVNEHLMTDLMDLIPVEYLPASMDEVGLILALDAEYACYGTVHSVTNDYASRNSSEILHHYEYEYAILACIERVMFVSWPDLSLVNTLAQQSVLPVDEDIIHNYINSNPSMVIVQSEAEEKVIARVDLEWLSDTARKALENNLDWN